MMLITFKHWLADFVEGFFSAAAAGGIAYLSQRVVSAKKKVLTKMDAAANTAQGKISTRINKLS